MGYGERCFSRVRVSVRVRVIRVSVRVLVSVIRVSVRVSVRALGLW